MYNVIIASIVVIAVTICYFYKRRNLLKEYGIPLKNSPPILGSMWPPLFNKKSYANVIQDIYNFHPTAKYIGFYNRTTPVIMIRDLELIKSITTKNFDHFRNHRNFANEDIEDFLSKNLLLLQDEKWKEIRSLITPAFTSSKMKSMFSLMSEIAVKVSDYLSDLPSDKNVVEMKDIFTRYTNDVFASCAFGISIDSLSDRDNEFYRLGRKALDIHSAGIFKLTMTSLFPRLSRKLGITLISKDIVNFFEEIVSSNISKRLEEGIERPDFIQTMLESRKRFGLRKELTDKDIAAQAFSFFFGGFETTSSLLSFAVHELAVNPEVQEKLYQDIRQVLQASNGEAKYEDLKRMKYLDAVINETLRLYPIIPITDRVCSKRFELPPALPGTKPYVLNQGAHVCLPIFAIQRDQLHFRKPDNFDPDRFLDRNINHLNSVASLPFGMGPRICIGYQFAMVEAKSALFQIIARCRLKVSDRTTIPMRLRKRGVFLTAIDGFWLQILPRNQS